MGSNITEVRAQEIANYAGYDQPDAVRLLCGFGQPMEYDPPILTDWALMQVWAPMIRVLADGFKVELEEIITEVDKRPLEKDVFVEGMGDFETGSEPKDALYRFHIVKSNISKFCARRNF